jgi:hypothetical protein
MARTAMLLGQSNTSISIGATHLFKRCHPPFAIGATHRFRRKLALLAKRRRLMDDLDVCERVAPPPRVALAAFQKVPPTVCDRCHPLR